MTPKAFPDSNNYQCVIYEKIWQT